MKVKIISLTLAAAIGLSACHSGGVSNNQATTVSSNTLTTMAAKTAASGGQQGGISSFLLQSVFGTFAMGTLGFPGTWFASIVSSWLFSWLPTKESQTTVMLKEINEKLTVVLNGLKTNLNLTASVQEITAAVYTLLTQQGITDSFTTFDTEIKSVGAKYAKYTKNNIFDSNESGDQYSMYKYAQQHCDDVAISDVLETTNSKPDDLYDTFYADFISSDTTIGAASTYQKVVNAKTAYKSAIVTTLPKSYDFMKYINEYNFGITYYRWKAAGNFQQLYAMQFAQIAYHYACGKKITFSNLGNLPAKSGESGFESGIELLNTTYSAAYQQLESNMETYMPLISNSEIYTMVNTKFSKTLLNSTSFNSNANESDNCSLSKLAFNSYTNNGQTSGVIDLQAICIATKTGSESNVKYESATIALEIPYHSSNNTSIDRLGQSNIKYDSTTKDLSSSVSTDALDSSDVSDIFNLRPEMAFNGTYWANKESMNLLAPSWINTTSTSNADRTYSGFSVKAANGVQFYSDEYTDSNPATQAEKDYKQFDSDFSYGNYVPAYDVSGFTTNSDLIQRYQYTTTGKALWGRGGGNVNPWDMIVGWEFWMLGDYHGKTFAVKVAFQHVSLIADWFDTTQPLTNRITAQVIGAYCLTSNCSRKDDGSGDNDTKTTLTWTDGTQVVFDETGGDDMTGYGDSSYLYTTTATGSINK